MSPAEIKRKSARQTIRRPVGTRTPERQNPRNTQDPQTQQNLQDPQSDRKHTPARQPIVVHSVETQMLGVRSFITSRYVVGYVVSGYKCIYTGDLRSEAVPGDVFFLSKGTHYIEELPESRRPFEQILFFYTPAQVSRIIAELSVNYRIETCVHHTCEECMLREYVIAPGWETLRHFFNATGKYIRGGLYADDPTAELLALTTLVYQIISRPEGCLRTRVLGSTDPEKELLDRQLGDYIFSDLTLEELAAKSNRSLSSFKKKFKEFYHEPPHRWVVRQRLMHARLQIISTDRDIVQIANECRFKNASYFIRLFRDEFGHTPSQYRLKYGNTPSRSKWRIDNG
ncbi:MAG: helix-turn-helix transcriptional regulator [Alistipes sp.]|jgi:AraC-like DNA-binding protein|nr:helix-turn-helix transcriptional regulator [Alistipes sp.]